MEEVNECRAVELRSRKELPNPYENQIPEDSKKNGCLDIGKDNEEGWVEVQKLIPQSEPAKYVSKLPYPQRQQKLKLNQNFTNFSKINHQYPICQTIGANT